MKTQAKSARLPWRILLVAGLVCVAACQARAVTLVDPLDNWALTNGHTPSLVLDTDNPNCFYNDNSRIKVDSGYATGSFGYHLKGITSFSGSVYYWGRMGAIQAFTSRDGTNWTETRIKYSPAALIGQPTSQGLAWYAMEMSSSDPLAEGTNYLGFTIIPTSDIFTPQIGQISIDFAGIDVPAPTGLTALAATSQVCLHWLPSTKATSYTIKRSTDGAVYHTIAQNVSSTMYTDNTAMTGKSYYYGVSAVGDDGYSDLSDAVTATPKTGTVLFMDTLTDMALVTGHTKNLTNGNVGKAWTIKRTKQTPESFYYNMPGLTEFAFDVYYSGDLKGQISADVSPDGVTWTPVALANSDPVKAGAMNLSVCSPVNKIPNDSNYVRFDIGAVDSTVTDSPQVCQVRLTYGQSIHNGTIAPTTAVTPSAAPKPASTDTAPPATASAQ